MMRPRRDGRLPGHRYLHGLKTQLGITANQERAWKEYADAVSGISEQMQALHQTRFNSMGAASWEERCNLMNQMFQARQQAFDTVHRTFGPTASVAARCSSPDSDCWPVPT